MYVIAVHNMILVILFSLPPSLPPSYDEFIDCSSKLNDIKNYPQLMDRSSTIGYEVTKVVFRGYHAGAKLQVYAYFFS